MQRGCVLALAMPPLPILYLASVGSARLIVMPVNAESWPAGLFSGLALCCVVGTGTMCLCHLSHVHFLPRSLTVGQERRQMIPMWKISFSFHLTMVLKWGAHNRLVRGDFFTVFFSWTGDITVFVISIHTYNDSLWQRKRKSSAFNETLWCEVSVSRRTTQLRNVSFYANEQQSNMQTAMGSAHMHEYNKTCCVENCQNLSLF